MMRKSGNKSNEIIWLSWLLLIANLFGIYLISIFEEYQPVFLVALIVNMAIALIFSSRINVLVLHISRILLGALFIYSGFVKGVDPLGTQYRIEDYFYAYGTDWAAPMAMFLSVVLNAIEFSLGALLLFRVKMKWVSLLSLIMMVFFTITTLYDALYSPVPDCGCFGDALIISNWQTFYKNLIINFFAILLFLRRGDFRGYKSKFLEIGTLAVVVLGFLFFENYNLNNLPIVDFRPWKVGNRLLPENPQEIKYFLTYKNINTGEEQEFISKELPWQDSTFMANWKWSSSREEDPNVGQNKTFPMMDTDGNDVSKSLVSSENYTYLFVIYDLHKVPNYVIPIINDFYKEANESGNEVVILSSILVEDFIKFSTENNLAQIPMLNSDDTSLKAAIRSNPGLIVVRKGVVVDKFHYNNFPKFKELINTYSLD